MPAGRFWRRYRVWIAVAAIVAVGAAAYVAYQGSRPEEATITYATEKAVAGTLSVTVSGTGNLQVREENEVTSRVSGTVADVRVDKGDSVDKGDVLFTLDSSSARQATAKALASLRQARQSVKQARISLLEAEQSEDDLESRTGTGAATETQLDIAEAKVDAAEIGLGSARASYTAAQMSYDDAAGSEADLVVRAPCGGTVWSVNIDEGDTVSGGSGSSSADTADSSAGSSGSSGSSSSSGGSSAPITIAEDGELAVLLSVNEVDLPTLKKGQDVEILFDALPELTVTGKVDEVDRDGTVSSGVVTYDVWVSLDVTDKRLRSGMSSSATIVTDVARNVLLVPNAAVKSDTDGTEYVQVLADGAAEPQQVTVEAGLRGSSQTQILSGIDEGTAVVTKTTDASDDAAAGSSGGVVGFGMGGGPR